MSLLDDRIPLAARAALPGPLAVDRPAGLTNIDRAVSRHETGLQESRAPGQGARQGVRPELTFLASIRFHQYPCIPAKAGTQALALPPVLD